MNYYLTTYYSKRFLKFYENFEIFYILISFWNFMKILKYWIFFWKSRIFILIYIFFEILNMFENLDFLTFWNFITPLPMVYQPTYPWYMYIDLPTHGILTPLTMVYRPPLPMVYWPPTHGISTPLPMVYQTLSYGIMNSSFGRNEGGFKIQWQKNWPRGQNTIRKIEPGVKIS